MPQLTVYLARLFGLFTVLIVVGLSWHGGAMVDAVVADKPIMFTYAIISLALGLAMVIGHNVWSGGALPVVVALLGWLVLAKGLVLLFLDSDRLTPIYGQMPYFEHVYFYLGPSLLIGLYLSWAGFTAPAARSR